MGIDADWYAGLAGLVAFGVVLGAIIVVVHLVYEDHVARKKDRAMAERVLKFLERDRKDGK